MLRTLESASLDRLDDTNPSVVRRYRREPSPPVRDASRGWRTGNLEQVLAGDFDLITA
jgi:ATP-dependent Clp protease ATP-binding subunit ClpC